MKIRIGVVIIVLVGIIAGVVVLASERSERSWHMDKKQKEAVTRLEQEVQEDEQKAREERKAVEERTAANLLSTAKLQITSNKATAKIILLELVRHRPDTKAAEEARTLLASMKD
jgi:preprotein translocase subunit SecF